MKYSFVILASIARRLLFLYVILCVSIGIASGTVINAVSPSLTDVQTAVTSANDGDIVVVPAGTSTWTGTLTINKRIVLQGSTTISGTTAPHTSDGSGRLTANDSTIILDGAISNGSGQRTGIIATWNDGDVTGATDGFHPRITGFTFRQQQATGEYPASNLSPYQGTYFLIVQGINHNVRIDNCHFDRVHRYALLVQGYILGVMDHVLIDQFYGHTSDGANIQTQENVEIWHDQWGATTMPSAYGFQGVATSIYSYGNQSWVEGPNLTSNQEKAFYIEDCQFNNNYDGTAGQYSAVGCDIDSTFGARYVCRYCSFPNGGTPSVHGTETGGQRGTRSMLCYRNSLTYPSVLGATNIGMIVRSGFQIFFDNDFHAPNTNGPAGLTASRQAMAVNMGVADGQNPWDLVNTDGGTGIGLGSTGAYVFRSSTVTATTPTSTTVAAASNGVNIQSFTGTGVLFVNDDPTSKFTATGTISVAFPPGGSAKTVTYTGKQSSPPAFTGCSSTQTGVMATGSSVSQGQVNTAIDTQSPVITNNQWNGYQLRRDATGTPSNAISSFITATNASTSKFTVSSSTGGATMAFITGDPYTIRQNWVTVDQAGRGEGDTLYGYSTGNNSTNATLGGTISPLVIVKSWPHQVLAPCYDAGNTINASGTTFDSTKAYATLFHSSYPTMIANRDYYNFNASFNGTSQNGVGRGTLASRPATGTNGTDIASGYYTLGYNPPGNAYWATDQGSWNGSGDGRGSGKLQVYTNGAWADYFVPYTYPHPLTTGLYLPVFVSATSTAFGVNAVTSFIGSATGNPTPTFTKTGSLPANTTFTDNGSGTFTIATTGVPTTTGSPFTITIHATNSQGTTDQTFTLTVSTPSTAIPHFYEPYILCYSTMLGREVNCVGTMTNDGNGDLVITDITGLGNDYVVVAGGLPLTVHPSGNGFIYLTFIPQAIGTRNKTFSIVSNATSGPTTQDVHGTGIIRPRLKSHKMIPR